VISAPLVRRSAINETGLFNTQLHGHEDWEYWIRLALKSKQFQFLSANNTDALVRVHANSAVQSALPMLLSGLQVRKELTHQPFTPQLHRLNQRGIGLQLAKLAKLETRNRNFRRALHYSFSALRASRYHPTVIIFLLAPQRLVTRLAITVDRVFR
jgi:hypothetical protein